MTIKLSGELRMSDISAEFSGGVQTTRLGNYYKNAGYIAQYLLEPNGIPSNGYIAFSDFYGAGIGYDSGTFAIASAGLSTHTLPASTNTFDIIYVIHYGGWGQSSENGSVIVNAVDTSNVVTLKENATISGIPNKLVYSVNTITNAETLISAFPGQGQPNHYTVFELHNFPAIGNVQSRGASGTPGNPTTFVNMRVTNLTSRTDLIYAHNPTHYYKIVIL